MVWYRLAVEDRANERDALATKFGEAFSLAWNKPKLLAKLWPWHDDGRSKRMMKPLPSKTDLKAEAAAGLAVAERVRQLAKH